MNEMIDYKGMIESLRICVKNRRAMDALCNAEFAADAIEQLVRERDELVTKCHRLEKERDAAVSNLRKYCDCIFCKWFIDGDCTDLKHEKCYGEHWEWGGVQNETN